MIERYSKEEIKNRIDNSKEELKNKIDNSKAEIRGMLDSSKDLRTGAACDATAALCWYGDDIPMEEITVENLKKLKEEYYGFKVD